MAKWCNVELLKWLSGLLESDQVYLTLLPKINLGKMWKEIFIDTIDWKQIIQNTDSQSAYDTLLSYARFKLLDNAIDRNRYVVSLVDRMKSYWYDSLPYNNFWEYINWLEWWTKQELSNAWLSVKTMTDWRNWYANKLLHDFQYALDVNKTVGKVDKNISPATIEKRITHKDLHEELETRFKNWSSQFWEWRKGYKKWLQNVFSELLWTEQGQYLITDKVLASLINHWLYYDTFADIIAYRYITSWKANFRTALELLENENLFKTITIKKGQEPSNFIQTFRNTDTLSVKKDKLLDYLYNIKKDKSFRWWEAIRKSMMIDNVPVWTDIKSINEVVVSAVSAELWTTDVLNKYKRFLNWETILDERWNAIEFDRFSPFYYFWFDEDGFSNIFPVNAGLMNKFNIDYADIRDNFIIDLIKKNNIKTPIEFKNMIINNENTLYSQIIDAIRDVSDWNTYWEWLIRVASNINHQRWWDIFTKDKRIVVIKNSSFIDWLAARNPERAKAMLNSYQDIYIHTSITSDNTKGVVMYDSPNEYREIPWVKDIVIVQDRLDNEDILKLVNRNIRYIEPQRGLLYDVLDWELVIRATSMEQINNIYAWLWDIINLNLSDSAKKNKLWKSLAKDLREQMDYDNKKSAQVINKPIWNNTQRTIDNLRQISQTTQVLATPDDILKQADKLLNNNLNDVKSFIMSYYANVDTKSFDWTRLTREDIAYIITSDTPEAVTKVWDSLLIDDTWKKLDRITDSRSFWEFILTRNKPLKIDDDWDIAIFKSFFQFLWDNSNIIDTLIDTFKKVDVQYNIYRQELESWWETIRKTLRQEISRAINQLSVISNDTQKETIIAFVDKFLETDPATLNRLTYITAKNVSTQNKIAKLWVAMEEYKGWIQQARTKGLDMSATENDFIVQWTTVTTPVVSTTKADVKKIKSLQDKENKIADQIFDEEAKLMWIERDISAWSDLSYGYIPNKSLVTLNREKDKVVAKISKLQSDKLDISDELAELGDLPDEIIETTPGIMDDLVVEARKYKSADEFVSSQLKKDYRTVHQVDTKTASSITDIWEDTIDNFTKSFRDQYGYPALKTKEVERLKKIMKNPDADVTIYRASPKNELNSGDRVTVDRDYANDIKRQNGGTVHKYTVKAKDLFYPKTKEWFEDLPSLSKWSSFQYQDTNKIWQLRKIREEANAVKDNIIDNGKKLYTINWGYIDRMKGIDWKHNKNIRKGLLSSITDENYQFGKNIEWWVSRFNVNKITRIIKGYIDNFTRDIERMWDGIILQNRIDQLNKNIRLEFNKIADEYGDIIRYIGRWNNTFNSLLFDWTKIPLETPKAQLKVRAEDIYNNANKKLQTLAKEFNTTKNEKTIGSSINRLLENWYTSVATNKWFATITLDNAIPELIEVTRHIDEVKNIYETISNIDWARVGLDKQQQIFSYLYALHFWDKMLSTLKWLDNVLLSKDTWELLKYFLNNYKIQNIGWVSLPKIFFNSSVADEIIDTHNNAKIFQLISDWYKNRISPDLLESQINSKIDEVFWLASRDAIDEVKQLYSIYPKMLRDETLAKLVFGNEIEWLNTIATTVIDSIDSFQTYKNTLAKYAPNVSIDNQSVYDMWYVRDWIPMDSYIPKFTRQQKYTSSFESTMDSLMASKARNTIDEDLLSTRC